MKTKEDKKNQIKMPRAGVIAVIAVSALVLLFIAVLLFLPSVIARSALREGMNALKTSSGEVVLCDPYTKDTLLPESYDVTVDGAMAEKLLSSFSSALSSVKYEETKPLSEMKWLPYLTVKGENVSFFYIEEDAVWVEKNAAFHRFVPSGEDAKTAYAAFYLQFDAYLANAK